MSETDDGPRCPECGGPIGKTSTYCMHCSADLTEELEAADENDNMVWDQAEVDTTSAAETTPDPESTADSVDTASTGGTDSGELLDPDGLVDNTLTVAVGIAGGILVGVVGTMVLLVVTGSGLAFLFGFFAWLGATAYLVRRRTVQAAVSKSSYAVAVVLLLVPLIAISPVVDFDGGPEGRLAGFVVLLITVAIPAAIAAAVGWVASRFVPESARGSEG